MSQQVLVTELLKQGFGRKLAGTRTDQQIKLRLKERVDNILDHEILMLEAKWAYEELKEARKKDKSRNNWRDRLSTSSKSGESPSRDKNVRS
jgi:hypothetical protein